MATNPKKPATKKRALGRGLDSLLGSKESPRAASTPLQALPIKNIVPNPLQPRYNFDAASLQSLANSISNQGILQPINVRLQAAGHYEIISGERRWRAAKLAGLTHIPAQVLSVSDQQAHAAALVENIQREDLSVVEEAKGMRRLVDEFGLTHEALAQSLGRSRAGVSNTLRLLKLLPSVLNMLAQGDLEMGHARALLAASGQMQVSLAERVVDAGLSVRQTEELVAMRMQASTVPTKGRAKSEQDPDTKRLMQSLSDMLGAEVSIHSAKRKGAGRLVIRYGSPEELEALLSRFTQGQK